MKTLRVSFNRKLIALATLAIVPAAALTMWGQEAQTPGVASDWTHHHVIFSHPGTVQEALQRGNYDRWLKITTNPRYTTQQQKRNGLGTDSPRFTSADVKPVRDSDSPEETDVPAGVPIFGDAFPDGKLPRGLARALKPLRPQPFEFSSKFHEAGGGSNAKKKENHLQRDWSETEGNNGSVGLGHLPATFTTNSAS